MFKFKKRYIWILLILIIVVIAYFGMRRCPLFPLISRIKKHDLGFPFKKGEVIDYDVRLYAFKIGRAQLSYQGPVDRVRNKKNIDPILISFLTDVANFHDKEAIYASRNSFNPIRVKRDIVFFGKPETIEEDYTLRPKSVSITKNKNSHTDTKVLTSDRPLQHAVSSIYYYRQLKDIKIGDKFFLNLPLSKLELEVKRIEEIKVPAGRFKAFYIESVPKRLRLWLSADEKRLPLKIMGAVSLAPTTMVMTNYKDNSHAPK